MAVATGSWEDVRRKQLEKFKNVLIYDYGVNNYYARLMFDFEHFDNVTPAEQERIVYDDLKTFIEGSESENIRISNFEDGIPTGIKLNTSFDPYIRSEINRFSDILISIATVKLCCRTIKNDGFTYSLIGQAVANAIAKQHNQMIHDVVKKLEAFEMESLQLNSLFRELYTLKNVLEEYANVVKTIYKKKLIGGQVLSFIYELKSSLFNVVTKEKLEAVFQEGWKIFAGYMERLMNRSTVDKFTYEFFIWPNVGSEKLKKNEISDELVLVPELCPSFLQPHIKLLSKYVQIMEIVSSRNKEIESNGPSVRWSTLGVHDMIRSLREVFTSQSRLALQTIRKDHDVDAALRDITDVLLRGKCTHLLLMHCIRADILDRKVEEVGEHRLRTLTEKVFNNGHAQFHHPFWKYFSFCFVKEDLFDQLAKRNGMESEMVEGNGKSELMFMRLSVSLNYPKEFRSVLNSGGLDGAKVVFRLLFLINVAYNKIAMASEELKGHMPSKGGDVTRVSQRRFFLASLNSAIHRLRQSIQHQANYAFSTFHQSVEKASSIEEFLNCQNQLVFMTLNTMDLNNWAHLNYIKTILTLVWRYSYGAEPLEDLLQDLEDILSDAHLNLENGLDCTSFPPESVGDGENAQKKDSDDEADEKRPAVEGWRTWDGR